LGVNLVDQLLGTQYLDAAGTAVKQNPMVVGITSSGTDSINLMTVTKINWKNACSVYDNTIPPMEFVLGGGPLTATEAYSTTNSPFSFNPSSTAASKSDGTATDIVLPVLTGTEPKMTGEWGTVSVVHPITNDFWNREYDTPGYTIPGSSNDYYCGTNNHNSKTKYIPNGGFIGIGFVPIYKSATPGDMVDMVMRVDVEYELHVEMGREMSSLKRFGTEDATSPLNQFWKRRILNAREIKPLPYRSNQMYPTPAPIRGGPIWGTDNTQVATASQMYSGPAWLGGHNVSTKSQQSYIATN
jgi:hypothetical protein